VGKNRRGLQVEELVAAEQRLPLVVFGFIGVLFVPCYCFIEIKCLRDDTAMSVSDQAVLTRICDEIRHGGLRRQSRQGCPSRSGLD
jgi:hypothetical protein